MAAILAVLLAPSVQGCSPAIEPDVPNDLSFARLQGEVLETNLASLLIEIDVNTGSWHIIGAYPEDVKVVVSPEAQSLVNPYGRFVLKELQSYSCCLCGDGAFTYGFEIREEGADAFVHSWGNASQPRKAIVNTESDGRLGFVDEESGGVDWFDWSGSGSIQHVAFDEAAAAALKRAGTRWLAGPTTLMANFDASLLVLDLSTGLSSALPLPQVARTPDGVVDHAQSITPLDSTTALVVGGGWVGRISTTGIPAWTDSVSYPGLVRATWTGHGILALGYTGIAYFAQGIAVRTLDFDGRETEWRSGATPDGGFWLLLVNDDRPHDATRFLHIGPEGRVVAESALQPMSLFIPLPSGMTWVAVLLLLGVGWRGRTGASNAKTVDFRRP